MLNYPFQLFLFCELLFEASNFLRSFRLNVGDLDQINCFKYIFYLQISDLNYFKKTVRTIQRLHFQNLSSFQKMSWAVSFLPIASRFIHLRILSHLEHSYLPLVSYLDNFRIASFADINLQIPQNHIHSIAFHLNRSYFHIK